MPLPIPKTLQTTWGWALCLLVASLLSIACVMYINIVSRIHRFGMSEISRTWPRNDAFLVIPENCRRWSDLVDGNAYPFYMMGIRVRTPDAYVSREIGDFRSITHAPGKPFPDVVKETERSPCVPLTFLYAAGDFRQPANISTTCDVLNALHMESLSLLSW